MSTSRLPPPPHSTTGSIELGLRFRALLKLSNSTADTHSEGCANSKSAAVWNCSYCCANASSANWLDNFQLTDLAGTCRLSCDGAMAKWNVTSERQIELSAVDATSHVVNHTGFHWKKNFWFKAWLVVRTCYEQFLFNQVALQVELGAFKS